MSIRIDSLRFAWIAGLALGGASACSVAVEDGNLAAADEDRAEEAVESASQAFTLSIPELAAVIAAFDAIEIAEAQIAATHATDAYVIELAQELLNHHTVASQQLLAALGQTSVVPLDNSVSLALIEQGASDQQLLEALTGPQFDWTYVNIQIRRHHEFLAHIKEQIVVVGPELHPGISHLVPDIRSATSRHLTLATSLLPLLGTPYVSEHGNSPRAPYDGGNPPYYGGSPPYYGGSSPYYGGSSPYYGGSSPYYGGNSPYYGGSSPYSSTRTPYGPYGRSTSLGSGAPSPYSPYSGRRP